METIWPELSVKPQLRGVRVAVMLLSSTGGTERVSPELTSDHMG